jgi:hypothetical protein
MRHVSAVVWVVLGGGVLGGVCGAPVCANAGAVTAASYPASVLLG